MNEREDHRQVEGERLEEFFQAVVKKFIAETKYIFQREEKLTWNDLLSATDAWLLLEEKKKPLRRKMTNALSEIISDQLREFNLAKPSAKEESQWLEHILRMVRQEIQRTKIKN